MSQWIEVEHMPDEFEGLVWVATLSSAEPVLCETWASSYSKKRFFAKCEFNSDGYTDFVEDVTHFHELITPRPLGK